MSRPIKVLVTADAVGGVWTYALDLALGLAERNVETALVVLGPAPSADQTAQAAQVPRLTLIDTPTKLDWTATNSAELTTSSRILSDIVDVIGPDIVHLNSPALAASARLPCPVVAACHSCLATWWGAVRGGLLPEDFRWRVELLRAGYAAADRLIAPSAAFARATAEAYRLPAPPIAVHNGRAARQAPARAGAAQVPSGPFVLTAGRLWDDGKNLQTLDRVAARLAAPVLAAGPTHGPNGASIDLRYARPIGNLPAPDLDTIFAARPVFASLALYEPFGLAVLEAAQAGCPLVLSDIPSFGELWEGAAVFIDPRDEDGAVRVLEALLDSPAERERLGRAAQARAGRYTVERMTAGTLAVYEAALARHGRSRRPASARMSAA